MMKVICSYLGLRYSENGTKYGLAFVSGKYFTFFYHAGFFMVDGHILYLWNMDYKLLELSNYFCPGQERTPLSDVQIRIFAQMSKISQKVCGTVNLSSCLGLSVNY